MQRIVIAAVLLAACGTVDPEDDDRPKTLEYISQAILAPACGNGQCHSSFTRAGKPGSEGYAFDTLEQCKKELPSLVVPMDVEASFLNTVLVRRVKRMPYDQPLPDVDIKLIQTWIEEGAMGLPTGMP
jgi:hypothetical protein